MIGANFKFENCKSFKTSETERPVMFLVTLITFIGLDFTDFSDAAASF
jgi:hypothetical protein